MGMEALDSFHVRRVYLQTGGKLRETARRLDTSHANVKQHLERADRLRPLTYQSGDPEDQRAMTDYVKECLKRAHISR